MNLKGTTDETHYGIGYGDNAGNLVFTGSGSLELVNNTTSFGIGIRCAALTVDSKATVNAEASSSDDDSYAVRCDAATVKGTLEASARSSKYAYGVISEGVVDVAKETELKANPIIVKAKVVTFSALNVKSKVQSVKASKAFAVKKAQGKVTYKVSKYVTKAANGKVSVSKGGKVTVKKGTPKGTYQLKVKVTAAGNAKYAKKSKTVALTVTVK